MIFRINSSVSINDILKSASIGDEIHLASGVYTEKVFINVDGIKIIGEDKDTTIITNHDFYHKVMADNNECNTFRTYTVNCSSNNVTIQNITIENSAIPSAKYGQAVALHVIGDNFICENCILKSAQDTLFTGPLPPNLQEKYKGFLPKDQLKGTSSKQKYINTTIYGDVDFIFGGAMALFDHCTIKCIKREHSTNNVGYVAAPSHNEKDSFGYLFYKCAIETLDEESEIYLARPWRDYGTAAFIECKLGDRISPLGFNKWNDTERNKTARFFEFSPGYDTSKREPWSNQLDDVSAKEYYKKYLANLF